MRRPAPVLPALLCAALAACASGAAREGSTGPGIRVVASGAGADIFQQSDARPVEVVVPAPLDRAWPALTAAFAELSIPTTTVEAGSYLVGNPALSVQGRLGEERLALYFNCGSNITGELASSARLKVSVYSQLVAHRDGALLRTLAQATANNPQGASADPVLCRSTGRLEGRLGNIVRLRALQLP